MGTHSSINDKLEFKIPDTLEEVYLEKIWEIFNENVEGEILISMKDGDRIEELLKEYKSKSV